MDCRSYFTCEYLSRNASDKLECYVEGQESYDSSVHSGTPGFIEKDSDSFSDSSSGTTSTYCDTTVISDTESRNNDGFEGEEHARELVVFELPPKMATTESNQFTGCKQRIKEIDLIVAKTSIGSTNTFFFA